MRLQLVLVLADLENPLISKLSCPYVGLDHQVDKAFTSIPCSSIVKESLCSFGHENLSLLLEAVDVYRWHTIPGFQQAKSDIGAMGRP